ncbi:DUF3429 domain-containing protein [Rhodopila sp.]|uniref:DUF3429 domain-containing protein n=1 Tax=Rhodopila sp. TaxID=2480087 RepID=UPI003D10006F
MKSTSAHGPNPEKATFRVEETPAVPWLGLFFGAIAMVPFVLGAAGIWILNDGASAWAARLTVIWGGAILSFLAGVRRGLSFRTPGGEDVAQMTTMLWLFLLALASLVLPWLLASLGLLIVGYASIGVLDPVAASYREAPLFFKRLRPVQMLVPVASLAVIVVHIVARG